MKYKYLNDLQFHLRHIKDTVVTSNTNNTVIVHIIETALWIATQLQNNICNGTLDYQGMERMTINSSSQILNLCTYTQQTTVELVKEHRIAMINSNNFIEEQRQQLEVYRIELQKQKEQIGKSRIMNALYDGVKLCEDICSLQHGSTFKKSLAAWGPKVVRKEMTFAKQPKDLIQATKNIKKERKKYSHVLGTADASCLNTDDLKGYLSLASSELNLTTDELVSAAEMFDWGKTVWTQWKQKLNLKLKLVNGNKENNESKASNEKEDEEDDDCECTVSELEEMIKNWI